MSNKNFKRIQNLKVRSPKKCFHPKCTEPLRISNSLEQSDNSDLCAICLERKNSPIQIDCRHSFCRKCLDRYLEERSWKATLCPLCRRPLNFVKSFPSWQLLLKIGILVALLSLGSFFLLILYW